MRSIPATALLLLLVMPLAACRDHRNAPEKLAVVSSAMTQSDGSTLPVFADDFNRTGPLGNEWTVIGAASANGSAAVLSSALTYAAWTGLPPENTSVSLSLSAPTATWVGVFTRGAAVDPDRSHYAAYVSSGGVITLARREEWAYTSLAEKVGSFASGTHKLTLTATGSRPVQLAVAVDGAEVLRYDDSSESALHGSGRAGFFDFNGSSQPLDKFEVAYGVHFFDDFNRSGPIGSNWTNAWGSYSCDGTRAVSAPQQSYAAWVGTANDPVVKATLTSPIASTYVGVFTRGGSVPDRDHYAAFVNPSGMIRLRRRNNYNYTLDLGGGVAFPSGTHVIGISTSGTNPVRITVTLDGATIIEYDDSSSSRLSSGNKVGIFDFNGSGQPIDDFTVADGLEASDDFGTGTSLGPDWTVSSGSVSVASSRAHTTAAQSYAFIGPSDALNATAEVEMDFAWLMQGTLSGVTLRATNGTQAHYAGGVNLNNDVVIVRRNSGVYTTLATGALFPTGIHTLSLTATGTDPVQLSLKIDGSEWLHYDDSSISRLTAPGRAGIFSNEAVYSSGQYFGKFDFFGDAIWPPWPPILREIPAITAFVDQTKTVFLRASDRNGGTLTFSGTNLPMGATILNKTLGTSTFWKNVSFLSWKPTATQVGTYTPTIIVTDATGQTDSQVVSITVSSECSPISTFETASPAPTPDPSKTFYVDGVNGNDSNAGSQASPFQTITKGVCTVIGGCDGVVTGSGAGSSVVIRRKLNNKGENLPYIEPSLYFENVAGTPSAPIWIGGEHGSEPLISDYQNPNDINEAHEVLQFVKPKYLVLHDMIIGRDDDGATRSHGINIDDGGEYDNVSAADHVIIEHIYFKKIGDGVGRLEDGKLWAVQNCIKLSGVNHFWILNNTFNTCGRGTSDLDAPSATATSRGGYGVNADGCHDGVIANNQFTGRTFTLSKGGSRNIEIRQNTSTVNLMCEVPNDNSRCDDVRAAYQLGGSMNPARFRPSLSGPGLPGEGLHYEARYIRLVGNVIQGGEGIRFEGCYQCLVANNTIVDPVDELFYVTQPSESLGAITSSGNPAFVSYGRVFNNIFYFSETPVKKARLDFYVDTTPNRWNTFQFNGNLYCNKSYPNTCGPLAKSLDDAHSGDATPLDEYKMEGQDDLCLPNASCDPQFAPTDAFPYPLATSTPASPAIHKGVSLTANSPNSVLEFTGRCSELDPDPTCTVAVEDRAGVCYATTPSRGAREVP